MNTKTLVLLFLCSGSIIFSSDVESQRQSNNLSAVTQLNKVIRKSAKIAFWTLMAAGIAVTGNNIRETMPHIQLTALPYGPLPSMTSNCAYHYSLVQDDNHFVSPARVDKLCALPGDPAVEDFCFITETCQMDSKPGWKKNVTAFWGFVVLSAAGWCFL